jgi:hypothetical protein
MSRSNRLAVRPERDVLSAPAGHLPPYISVRPPSALQDKNAPVAAGAKLKGF